MKTTVVKALILLSAVWVLLTGCATSTPTHFYVLEPVQTSEEASSVTNRKKLIIGIGPVEIPKLLDRTQIVTQHEKNRVDLAEFHQWGEPLEDNITRVLTRNIAALRTNDVIRSFPWGAFGTVDYRVVLNISQFNSIPGSNVRLEVDWTIMKENNHQVLKNGHSTVEQAIDNQSYTTIIDAMNKTLGELSQELSNSLDNVTNEI